MEQDRLILDRIKDAYERISFIEGEKEVDETYIDYFETVAKFLTKVKEAYTRSIETSLSNNNWWLHRINAELVFTDEPLWYTTNSAKAADWITKEALVEAANKYLNTERVITAYLKPEK